MSHHKPGSQDEIHQNQSSFGNEELASRVDLTPYFGRWVAIAGDRIAGVGDTALSAEHMGRRNRVREQLAVYFVEPLDGTPFPFSEIFEKIRPILTGMDVPIYLVGGAVRDGLLGQESHDLDFVVPNDGIDTAFKVANELGYPVYVLDKERDAGRVVLDEPGVTLDFTSFRGPDLDTDLRARDFTINAMALPVAACNTKSLIDPLDGSKDLSDQQLRLCYPEAIHDDPVRGLRAIRLLIATGIQPTEATISAVTNAAPLLTNVSEERIRDELLKLLSTDQPAIAVDYLVLWQILPTILPEFKEVVGVNNAQYVTDSSLARTKKLLGNLVSFQQLILDYEAASQTISADAASQLTQTCTELLPYQAALASHFNRQFAGGLDGWLVMRIAAFFHELIDTGAEQLEPYGLGSVPLENKDRVQLVGNILKRYRFSNQVCQHVRQTLRAHGPATHLSETKRVDRRTAYRFFKAVNDAGLDICLLSLAGKMVSVVDDEDTSGWTELLKVVTQLMDFYFNHYETTIQPTPLLDGNDLIKHLSLVPGPEIGQLLQLVEEAQAAGEVQSRSEALELAREHASND